MEFDSELFCSDHGWGDKQKHVKFCCDQHNHILQDHVQCDWIECILEYCTILLCWGIDFIGCDCV